MQRLQTSVLGPAFAPLCLLQPAADKRRKSLTLTFDPYRRFAAAQQVGSYWGVSGGAMLGVSLSGYDAVDDVRFRQLTNTLG